MRETKKDIKKMLIILLLLGKIISVGHAKDTVNGNGGVTTPPREVKLLIASFGTIESQAEVEGWLSDQLRPNRNVARPSELSAASAIANPELAAEAVFVNWKEKKLEYWRESEVVRKENARRQQLLINLKTATLSNASQRYTILGRDYLHAAIRRLNGGRLIKIVDRGNMTIQQTEKQIKDDVTDMSNGADCILSIVMGDREEDLKTIPIDNVGTKIVRTVYSAPYVGKIRDLNGNLLTAFNGTATIKVSKDNVVESSRSDPARKLIEQICEQVAKEIVSYFTTELCFKVKVPSGFDADDVEIFVDGKSVDNDFVRVLAFEHSIKAVLDGCKAIVRTVSVEEGEPSKVVKLNFKKTQ